VRGRIFDPRTAAVDQRATLDPDDLVGTIFNDRLTDFFGNDRLRSCGGNDHFFGKDNNDTLIGDAGHDGLDGGACNDAHRGGIGSDRLYGCIGNDVLDGGAGNDLPDGCSGNDIYIVDTMGDLIIELAGVGTDKMRSSTLLLNLTNPFLANVEHATLLGTQALNLTGNAAANTLRGRGGADVLSGLGGVDRFVMDTATSADTTTDFLSGTDKLVLSKAGISIGNGDAVINGALTRSAPGGFSTAAELVIFTANIIGTVTTTKAATIGSATTAFVTGSRRLIAVDHGTSSALFLFPASGNDALVSAGELRLITSLQAPSSLQLSDLQFQTL
jgi:Ca2+-binding RTX toxin-like protein